MSPGKISEIIKIYEDNFKAAKIQRKRISLDKDWSACSRKELLGHAYYLLSGIKKYLKQKGKVSKIGRHLGSIQTILMITGWQTLKESMNHNKPRKKK